MRAEFQRGNMNAGEQLKDCALYDIGLVVLDKASAYLVARRFRGSGRSSDVQNTKICCEFIGILFSSSDRRIFL